MTDSRKQKLIDLRPHALADALLNLAVHSDEANIRYLKKLDKLAASVADWKEFNHHEAFKEKIIQAHGRKRSFWSKYEVKK